MQRCLVTLLLLTTFACGDSTPQSAADAGSSVDASTDPEVDLTIPMFDKDRVINISIDMAPADWDSLRFQTRSIFDVLGSSCLEDPPERPFTYFPATVTIDGDVVTNVGVRKKGFFGSLSETKPSLKVKFSEYDDTQLYSGMKRMTLNNSISDISYVKQCIGYDLFRQAGIPSPRCNFATIEVNGQNMGLYVHVESIKKRFIARHFDDNDGNLYEGALSDFRPGWVNTFQKKTNKTNPDRSDIEALVPLMSLSDSEFVAELEKQVDVEQFISMWAAELIMMHADGYARNTNNFYMYKDPTSGKFTFIPWGIDSIMFGDVTLSWEDVRPPVTVWAEGVLARRLYNIPATRARYFAKLDDLLTNVWDEDEIHSEVTRMEQLIEDHVITAELDQFQAGLNMVRDFIDGRRTAINNELGTEPNWGTTLRDPWCIATVGTASGSFSTTFGTLDDDDPLNEGTASMSVTINGTPYTIGLTGALSGHDEESGQAVVRLVGQIDTQKLLLVQLAVNETAFVTGASLPIDWLDVSGYVLTLDFSVMPADVQIVGVVGDGNLTLDSAGTGAGATVAGSFTATVYEPFF